MGDLAHPLKIRAHHLLCLLGFRGLGYSQEFIEKMGKVAEELRQNAAFPIVMLAECDAICASCPHNLGSRCQKKTGSESRVRAKDREVLRRLGFEVGAQAPVGDVWATVKEKLTPEDMAEICRGCEWLELGYLPEVCKF